MGRKPFDLKAAAGAPVLVRGGRCILPGMGVFELDLRLEDGRVHSIGRGLPAGGCEVFEAGGRCVMPGVIDPHTHVGLFSPFATEIATESRSALLNGVTTMGVYLGGRESYLEVLDEAVAAVGRAAAADVFFHLVISTRRQLEEIPVYRSRYGITSFKAYMCGIPGLIPSLDDGFLMEVMAAVAGLGPGAVLNIHAENHDLVEWTTARMKAQGPQAAGLPDWTATHPALGEAEAVQRAVLLAEQAGTRLYFVHISSAEALRVIRRLKSAGGRFFVETTSPYLSLTDQTDLGALAKMVPPVRGPAERQALWEALQADLIDAIGSDHTPLTRAEKKAGAALWEVMPGYPAVGTHLPSLLHFARRFDFPLLRLAEKTALNPARIFGLYPAKGTLLPGSDADLVVVDPGLTRRVEPARMASRSDFALHQGDELTGWPTAVFKGGIPMVMDGRPCENLTPAGRYLGRGGTP